MPAPAPKSSSDLSTKTLRRVLNSRFERMRRAMWMTAARLKPELMDKVWRVKRCALCGKLAESFVPISKEYQEMMKSFGWNLDTYPFETLNHNSYHCPHCYSADRDRLIGAFLQKWCQEDGGRKAESVLDFAPTPSLNPLLRRISRKYRSADLYMPDVDDRVDIVDMKEYVAGQFDLIICSHVLEHIPDDRKAMAEIRRVLAPNGIVVLLVPILKGLEKVDEDPSITDEQVRWKRFAQGDHVRMYNRSTFLSRLEGAGLKMRMISGRELLASQWYDPGFSPDAVLYVGGA